MQDRDKPSPSEQQTWLRSRLDAAVRLLIDLEVFTSEMIEVKPAWAAPGHYLIGRARETGDDRTSRWFICGQGGTLDHLPGDTAETARDAARHFSMKWQLDATRVRDPEAAELVERAELLYALVDNDRLWTAEPL